jgi:hypothetical protein
MPEARLAEPTAPKRAAPPLGRVLLLAAMAGGMGWGIRGQYGHETGAMVPGLLVALVIGLLFSEGTSALHVARAVGLAALGISFGASETYAQTVGLTHDPGLRGNWHALAWGMTGLFLKGALWIGLGGAFLGIGFSTKRYRAQELALLLAGMAALMVLGVLLLNRPFDLPARRLPPLYFSASWAWQPDKPDLKPRPENWGGLLLALLGLLAYLGRVRNDVLARNLALWGVLFGGLGFAGGQCVQAYHAWNVEGFRQGWFARFEPAMNWWNLMETTFGAVMGAGLGLGVWLNRRRLGPKEGEGPPALPPWLDAALIALWAAALAAWEFADGPPLEAFAAPVFTMALLPAVGLLGGGRFPYAYALPLLALPIAGKTLRQLCYKTHLLPPAEGWTLLLALPLLVTAAVAWLLYRHGREGASGREFARWALLTAAWVHYGLNFAFFEWPWPWAPLTFRASNTLIFTACLLGLTWAAVRWRH